MEICVEKIAENLPWMFYIYLIMLHINRNFDIKFQPSTIHSIQENHVSPTTFQTYGHTHRHLNYREASLQNNIVNRF